MALVRPYPRYRRSVLSEVGCLCMFLDATSRRSYATTAYVRPPDALRYSTGALPSPAPPLPSEAILAAPCGRTVLDVGRRAPVRPLRAADSPRPSPLAAWTPPFRGGSVRCRVHPEPLPPRRQVRSSRGTLAPLVGLPAPGSSR